MIQSSEAMKRERDFNESLNNAKFWHHPGGYQQSKISKRSHYRTKTVQALSQLIFSVRVKVTSVDQVRTV